MRGSQALRVVVVALAALVATTASAELIVSESNAASFYRDYRRLTKVPRRVDPVIASLCTTFGPPVEKQERAMTGPHYRAHVHVYVNPVGMSAVSAATQAFPPGSIIVKEKLATDGKVTGVGGMIKRASGYDAVNGDWEYFYYGGPSRFSSGRIANCIECHRAANATDYVYSVRELAAD
jgi:hypothetical protein